MWASSNEQIGSKLAMDLLMIFIICNNFVDFF
jgi:hypothetical protein